MVTLNSKRFLTPVCVGSCVSFRKETQLGTSLKNPYPRTSQSSPVFPWDRTPSRSPQHPAPRSEALITQWVLVDDMRLVCITWLHWGGHPGHHWTGALGPGVRERTPQVLATSRIWILPILSVLPALWKILAGPVSPKQKPEKIVLFLSDRASQGSKQVRLKETFQVCQPTKKPRREKQ